VLQLPDNCLIYCSRDSALVSLLLCTPSILFPCRETRASNLIMLIVASEGQCFPCFPLSRFPFSPGFLYNDPSHVRQIRKRLTTFIPDLIIKDLLSAISSSERVFRCIPRADTGFCQRLLLRMVVTTCWLLNSQGSWL
jgi:hypothetical protein